MYQRGSVTRSAWMTIAAGCLLGIMLLGGCPQQQVPDSQTPDDQSSGDTQTPPSTPPEDDDRPIIQPPIEDDGGDDGGGGTGGDDSGDDGDGGDGGDSGGGGGSGVYSLTYSAPLANVGVRPGTIVDLTYRLTDVQSIVTAAELSLVRVDADGVPTGDPFRLPVQIATGTNTIQWNSQNAAGIIATTNDYGRFKLGLFIETEFGDQNTTYAPGIITIDAIAPTSTWVAPEDDHLINPGTWNVQLQTTDNSPHTVKVYLDRDTNPNNGFQGVLVPTTTIEAGTGVRSFTQSLSIDAGTYYYYVVVSDGIDPPTAYYAPNLTLGGGALARLAVTNRLIAKSGSPYDLNLLATSGHGAILQGMNFNDMAGTSMVSVPDLDGDGAAELVIGARFGKPNLSTFQGQGWGEAYMIFSKSGRISGIKQLNSVGGTIDGVNFRGIRTLQNANWTFGLSSITVIDDMDGDDLPEIVFSFPRVESLTLGSPAFVQGTAFQHPDLLADLGGMGSLEFDAIDYMAGAWVPNYAQFTRGGVVIVSSHNALLTDRHVRTRKFDRVMDLHEIGQLFDVMSPPFLRRYVRKAVPNDPPTGCANCEPELPAGCVCGGVDPDVPCESGCEDCGGIADNPDETAYNSWIIEWDSWFGGGMRQGPGGFNMPWTTPYAADPPLANYPLFTLGLPQDTDPCVVVGCELLNAWYGWIEEAMCFIGIPQTSADPCLGAWVVDADAGLSAWTGFYGSLEGGGGPRYYSLGGEVVPPTSIGCRILGEEVNDQFGTTVSSDGTWLYMTAPTHTATVVDVPSLPADRPNAGVVYQLRTDVRTGPQGTNLAQLWIEPGLREIPGGNPEDPPTYEKIQWPYLDAEIPSRLDYTMPTPHQFIIETIGSLRGNYGFQEFTGSVDGTEGVCLEWAYTEADDTWVSPADEAWGYLPYPTGTSGYYTGRTPQIVGPHEDAKISFVRGLGDIDGDGVRDFAVGSPNVRNPGGLTEVGAIYIVYGRAVGLEGDYLLENLQLAPSDPFRLRGIMLKGSSAGEKLARSLDTAGDFNGDGYADVIVGNENGSGGKGEAIIILGSPSLYSPENGWTVADVVAAGHAIRFVGEANGDLFGANVASAGDVDNDGYTDVLIAAPGAAGGKGAVYLVYGSPTLGGEVSLANVGTVDLPGAKFLGRAANDQLGGGQKSVTGVLPDDPGFTLTAYSRGVATLGDIDGDGRDDYAISAALADPGSRIDAGEVYILYGRGD